ncbi:MAG: hypothetical protein IJ111_13570 [Eggerthellaceae bacterium]|nr:hypothetical protein [Eggerthellaceae bacterium]
MMAMKRTDLRERNLEREKQLKQHLMETTDGLEDCGKSSHGRFVSGCRCRACRDANNAYKRQRVRNKAYGRPSYLVDAEPVRQRIRKLQSMGYTYDEIERLSGVGHTTIHGIMVEHWRTGKPVKRCKRATKDAIFGIRGQRRVTQGQKMDASEMVNDCRRWMDAGLSVAAISRTSGLDRQIYDALLHGRRSKVFARTLHAHRSARPTLDRMAGSYMPDAMEVIGL